MNPPQDSRPSLRLLRPIFYLHCLRQILHHGFLLTSLPRTPTQNNRLRHRNNSAGILDQLRCRDSVEHHTYAGKLELYI
jgi:hypothetical protein